jgi:hypothetical protein
MAFGTVGLLLQGMQKGGSSKQQSEGYTDTVVRIEGNIYMEELILFLLILGIALIVASQCGGGFRQYAAAILEPYAYLIIRLAVPCGAPKA